MTHSKVVVITGTPGTGKSKISQILSLKLGATHVDLSKYAKIEGLILGSDDFRQTEIVDMKALREKVNIFPSRNRYIIIEGHYAQDIVPHETVAIVVVLRRAPWVLKKELESRGYSHEKVRENLEAELLGVCLSDALGSHVKGKVCEIDTINMAAEETVNIILELIESKRKCLHGHIDWMEYPETKSLLREL
jgi:adenylate kinase